MILDVSDIHANAQFILTLAEIIQTSSEILNIYAWYRGNIARKLEEINGGELEAVQEEEIPRQ